MEKPILLICDQDLSYIDHFLKFFWQSPLRETFPYELIPCANAAALRQQIEIDPPDLLLLNANLLWTIPDPPEHVLLLSDSPRETVSQDTPFQCISKYQPMDQILRKILDYSVSSNIYLPLISDTDTDHTRFIGIFSVSDPSLQTAFALSLGHLLSRKNTVLYLNPAPSLDLSQLTGLHFDTDLMDLFYCLRNQDSRFRYCLEGSLTTLHGISLLPPPLSAPDLLQLGGEDWAVLLSKISALGIFDYILLDLGEGIPGYPDLLEKCSRIYTPYRDSVWAKAKQSGLEALLCDLGANRILDRTCLLPLSEEPFAKWDERLFAMESEPFLHQIIETDFGGSNASGINSSQQ